MTPAVNNPSVAIVILNWNGQHFLEQFMPSILASNYENFEVLVADNASTDGSVAFLKKQFPTVRLILLSENYGFAEGYNRALKEVKADYYILLNSDVEVTRDWIRPVVRLMEADATIAACQPKILALRQRSQFEYAGAAGGWIDEYGFPFCRGRVFDVCEDDAGQYDTAGEVFWASGACLFIRAELFHKIGGFDSWFFAHQEEIDLCWRLQNEGYKIWVQPDSVVYHLGGGSLEKGSTRKLYLNFRNNLIMLCKNLHPREAFWVVFKRLSLDGLAALHFLLKGKVGSFWAVMKSHFAFYLWLFGGPATKKSVRKLRRDLRGLYRGSIVWDHYIKKKKRFSEIVHN